MSMIVVSDSSPLRALHHLNLLHLFQQLYTTVIVPEVVSEELHHPTTTCRAFEIMVYPGFEVRRPTLGASNLAIPPNLDAGETQAIGLALELGADLLLIDERTATDAARRLGLPTIGVFGVLLEAKRRGMIDHVLPLVDRLVAELRFFTSAALRRRLAELSGE